MPTLLDGLYTAKEALALGKKPRGKGRGDTPKGNRPDIPVYTTPPPAFENGVYDQALAALGALVVGGYTLTFSFGGNYTLTAPKTGTIALGTGSANKIAVWSDANTITNTVGYEDLPVLLTSLKLAGVHDPGFAQFKDNGAGSTGVFCYWFDASTNEEVFFGQQMPHAWTGTTIHPHVHWTPKTTADGAPASQKVEWGLEYTWTDIGGDFANTSIIYGNTHTPADANVVAGRHYLTDLGDITPSASQDGLSSILVCRLFRNATDATDDTYEADAGLLQFDFHYERDRLGSATEYE